MQQGRQTRVQELEETHLLLSGELSKAERQLRFETMGLEPTRMAHHGGTATIRRKSQRDVPGQLSGPILQLLTGLMALHPLPLPVDVVHVLAFGRGTERLFGASQRGVHLGDFRRQPRVGPTVGDDVVRGDQKDIFQLIELQHLEGEERAFGQIERPPPLGQGATFDLTFSILAAHGPEVAPVVVRGDFVVHQLTRPAFVHMEGRPEDLMTASHGVNASAQEVQVQRDGGASPQRSRVVEHVRSGRQLRQEPHPFLAARERVPPVRIPRHARTVRLLPRRLVELSYELLNSLRRQRRQPAIQVATHTAGRVSPCARNGT